MATRSVNKVILVGNLTRDPELRYTPQGTPVGDFGLATNRDWVSNGERQESVEFHNIVVWSKLAELCTQLLQKGSLVYIEGRLQTRDWQTESGEKRYKTEIIANEMVLLARGKAFEESAPSSAQASPQESGSSSEEPAAEMDEEEIDLDELLSGTDFDIEEEQA